MDSLTQAVLGAAVSEAVTGKQFGRKASVWGALLGTFPDLDVLIPMGNPVNDFVYHRSFSHSLFVLAACAPLFVWIIGKIHPTELAHKKSWYWCVLAVFWTHIFLDSLTVYGTQIFWPISSYPVSIGSIFIVDPAYTLPLLFGCFFYLLFRDGKYGYRWNLIGLSLSSLYLVWTVGAQKYFQGLAVSSLEQQGIRYESLLTQPTPFNTLLWRFVVMESDGYRVGYQSILDRSKEIIFIRFKSENNWIPQIADYPAVKHLKNFTHGFYGVQYSQQKVIIADLRMGLEPSDYVFQFSVAKNDLNGLQEIVPVRINSNRSFDRLGGVWHRIFDETIQF